MLKPTYSFSMLPNNKLLLCDCYVISKLSWPLIVTSLSKTWVIDNFDSVDVDLNVNS